MAYSTSTDVQAYFPNITFGTTTPVTLSQITDYHIVMADNLIDASLRQRYSVPIANTTDISLLKSISMRLAAQSIADVMHKSLSGENPDAPDDASIGKWGRGARLDLAAIADGRFGLLTSRSAIADGGVFDDYDAVTTPEVKPLNRMNDEW